MSDSIRKIKKVARATSFLTNTIKRNINHEESEYLTKR